MSSTNITNEWNEYRSKYSVPAQTRSVFEEGILNNPLVAKDLPKDAKELGKKIKFHGNDAPSIPINWRFAESVSALKGMEAVMVLALLKKKYNTDVEEVTINTYVIFILLWTPIVADETIATTPPCSSCLRCYTRSIRKAPTSPLLALLLMRTLLSWRSGSPVTIFIVVGQHLTEHRPRIFTRRKTIASFISMVSDSHMPKCTNSTNT